LEYGDGESSGIIFNDTVTLSDLTANTTAIGEYISIYLHIPNVPNNTVGAANRYSFSFELAQFPPDGLVGMAFPSISVFNSTPLFNTLVDQGTVDPMFGLKLAENGSELYLGGVNTDLYTGDFRNVSLAAEV
jgi:hypothetical protein